MASQKNKRRVTAVKKPSYTILVSACLAGIQCTYAGGAKERPHIRKMAEQGTALAICPEVLGGSPIPREACEISGGDGADVLDKKAKVITVSGSDVSGKLIAGARKTLQLVNRYRIKTAILKSKSPSCGSGWIYDGSFTGTLKKGDGVTASLLRRKNIKIFSEDDDYAK